MTKQHTKGIWTASPIVSFPFSSPPARFEGAEIKSECGKLYVFLPSKNPNYTIHESDAETIANAQLIAAAPDLLEMLEAVTDALAGHELNNGDVSAINKARAAIAKATGK